MAAPSISSRASLAFDGIARQSNPADILSRAKGKAREQSRDFESMFLNAMLEPMFTAVGNDGPLGGGPAVGMWRSFLTNEYSKSIARNGGIGIADHVYSALIKQQEAR